jgi:hypothetical protein
VKRELDPLEPRINLAAHEDAGLPCLCARCLPQAPETFDLDGIHLRRALAVEGIRMLHFWYPEQLEPNLDQMRRSISAAIKARRKEQLRKRRNRR